MKATRYIDCMDDNPYKSPAGPLGKPSPPDRAWGPWWHWLFFAAGLAVLLAYGSVVFVVRLRL